MNDILLHVNRLNGNYCKRIFSEIDQRMIIMIGELNV